MNTIQIWPIIWTVEISSQEEEDALKTKKSDYLFAIIAALEKIVLMLFCFPIKMDHPEMRIILQFQYFFFQYIHPPT